MFRGIVILFSLIIACLVVEYQVAAEQAPSTAAHRSQFDATIVLEVPKTESLPLEELTDRHSGQGAKET